MDENVVVTIGGEKYELILTMRATREITKKYGGLDKLGEALSQGKDSEDRLSGAFWLIALLANQSVLIHNLKNPQDRRELLTEEHIELLTAPIDFKEINAAATLAIAKGMKRTVESADDGDSKKKIPGA